MAVSAQDNRVLLNEDDLSYIHGVLRVEIKEASKIYEVALKTRLYVQVTVGGHWVKRTTSVTRSYGQQQAIVWGQTKHFPVEVFPNKKHKANLITVELFCCSSHPDDLQHSDAHIGGGQQQQHQHHQEQPMQVLVGAVAFHLHDVIKQSPVDGVFDLFHAYQTVGELKLSLAFSYGVFGYGYSSQLNLEQHTVLHYLTRSLFPRIDPSPLSSSKYGRSVDDSKQVLVPKATRHPLFIPFNQRIHLGFGQEIAPTLDNIQDTSGKFSLLGNDMRRFNFLQDQLRRESSRTNKLGFLSSLLLDNNKKSEAIKDGLEANFERNGPNAMPGKASLMTLSHEEMKERGLFVVSLPKDQDRGPMPTNIDNSDSATANTSGNANINTTATNTNMNTNTNANANSNTTLVQPNTNKGGPRTPASFRNSLPLDASILPSPPHSMATPLLNHPHPHPHPTTSSRSASLQHQPSSSSTPSSPIPASLSSISSSIPSSSAIPGSPSLTNPHIQRLKMNL